MLGRNELGVLAPGKAADVIGVRLDTLSMAGGAVHDPLGALLLCTVQGVDFSVINGQMVVHKGKLLTLDLEELIGQHNRIARKIVQKYPVPERFKLV